MKSPWPSLTTEPTCVPAESCRATVTFGIGSPPVRFTTWPEIRAPRRRAKSTPACVLPTVTAMGVPVVRMKLLGFAVGASFASAVGVLFAAKQVFINPESFTFMESIGVLAMVILGGMGSIPGAIVGATGVTILNLQLLKSLSIWLNNLRQSGAELTIPLLGSYPFSQLPAQFEPAKYERMVFGLILIIMMIFRPQGILPPGYERKK